MGLKRRQWKLVRAAGLPGPKNEGKSRATRKGKKHPVPSITARAYTLPETSRKALGNAVRVRSYSALTVDPHRSIRWTRRDIDVPVKADYKSLRPAGGAK